MSLFEADTSSGSVHPIMKLITTPTALSLSAFFFSETSRGDGTVNSDEELIAHLVGGDESALESLYSRHSKLLYALAARITGDAGSAEELVQDIFFQLWQQASRFDSARGSLIGWLLTITRHRAISRLRQKKGQFTCDLCDETFLPPGIGMTVLEQHIARELVTAALAGLPECQLEAITLAYFDGLTSQEIAVHTRTPLGTIKSRLRSALGTMRRTLADSALPASPKSAKRPTTLDDILITGHLLSRCYKQRSSQREAECLQTLAQVVAASPEHLVDSFLTMALDLCGAGTAGLSFLETDASGEQVFRWTHLTGKLAKCVGGTTPRHFSPCGVTLDRNSPQLFEYPGRYFQYFNQVDVPIVEGLVIPFRAGKGTEGTVWIVSHDEKSRFDSEDARIMTTLTEFAGCALHLIRSLKHDHNSESPRQN